jgi:hypothetical protein
MKHLVVKVLATVSLSAALLLTAASPVFADSTGTQGQPNQSCGSQTAPSNPPGFDTGGFTNAENHYAGTQPQNSGNPDSVSQYDVACFQFSQHHP